MRNFRKIEDKNYLFQVSEELIKFFCFDEFNINFLLKI